MRTRPSSRRRTPPPPATTGSEGSRRARAAGLAVFALVFTSLQLAAYTQKSATWDEPIHLTAGYAAVADGDYRVDPSHPPFLRAWAALPLFVLPHHSLDTSEIDRTAVREWFPRAYDLARRFLYEQNDADRLLYAARFMVVLWGVVLGLLVFAWAYEWLGATAAILALTLYTVEPNLGAHSALVTTDFGITCFVFGAVYCLWRLSRAFTAGNLAAFSICVALAAVTKFSAVLLAPIVIVLVAAAAGRSAITPRRGVTTLGVAAAVTVFAIWAAYGFRYLPSATSGWRLTGNAIAGSDQVPWLAALVGGIDRYHLLPNAFSEGFLFSQASVRQLPGFLAGEIRPGGWWYYFPVAFALKAPLAMLALLVAGAIPIARRAGSAGHTTLFVLGPVVIWLLAAMASGVNLGVRHILPIYPFLILVAAAGAADLVARRGIARATAVAALLLVLIEVGRAYPYQLSFFNALAGGPENGYRYLADSNLGWGGSLKPLKRWMEGHGVADINLAYFGSADPAYYGIRATYLPSSASFLLDRMARPRLPGYVAISATDLDGVYLPEWWRSFYAGFADLQPVAVVGHTIRVYWVEEWPKALPPADDQSLQILAEGLLFGLHWPEQAAIRYREYLDRRPDDAGARNGLSLALAQTGRTVGGGNR